MTEDSPFLTMNRKSLRLALGDISNLITDADIAASGDSLKPLAVHVAQRLRDLAKEGNTSIADKSLFDGDSLYSKMLLGSLDPPAVVIPQGVHVYATSPEELALASCEHCKALLCQSLLLNPCGHIICDRCVGELAMNHSDACLVCSETIRSVSQMEQMAKSIKSLSVSCPKQIEALGVASASEVAGKTFTTTVDIFSTVNVVEAFASNNNAVGPFATFVFQRTQRKNKKKNKIASVPVSLSFTKEHLEFALEKNLTLYNFVSAQKETTISCLFTAGKLSKLAAHLDVCDFGRDVCPNSASGCPFEGYLPDVDSHLTWCMFERTGCPLCGETVLRQDLVQHELAELDGLIAEDNRERARTATKQEAATAALPEDSKDTAIHESNCTEEHEGALAEDAPPAETHAKSVDGSEGSRLATQSEDSLERSKDQRKSPNAPQSPSGEGSPRTYVLNEEDIKPTTARHMKSHGKEEPKAAASTTENLGIIKVVKYAVCTMRDQTSNHPFVAYTIMVPYKGKALKVHKRFNDLKYMHQSLEVLFPAVSLPSKPPERWWYFGGNKTGFVAQRAKDVERYLQKLAGIPIIAKSRRFRDFLTTSGDYVKVPYSLK